MFAPLRLALSFLTCIPLPPSAATPAQLGAAVGWFPLVGAVLGGAQYLLATLLHGALEPGLAGVALVALGAALTGALHMDGLADVFDGLGGAHGDRARMLEIMRDPRIGAHGATALVLCLLAKTVASGALCARGDWLVLFAAPVCGRFAAVALIRAFPYARADGLGRSFRDHVRARDVGLAALLAAAALAWTGQAIVIASLIGLLLALVFGVWIARRAGGLTGDAYGAAIELTELVVLIAV